MKDSNFKSAIDAAAFELRAIIQASEDGALLGSEEALVAKLGVSRATVRQVARLLEREGLLRVRRGTNGGYFATRLNLRAIESTVSAYLEMVDTNVEDTTVIASALWVEVLRKAAGMNTEEAKALAERFRSRVDSLQPDATFEEVLSIELKSRTEIFELIKSRYIELIFQINAAFSQRRYPGRPSDKDGTAEYREFVHVWRRVKLLELNAIADGDQTLAIMAARSMHSLWHCRLWGHIG
ncbi:MAG: transcriptional regulator [Hydrocarboniphaga sp.]|uniref:FadR/GntR family transcriptional regulator n=1 Tax=Hydrocarboniphaga sp. TaxID=2033016 RepID=UPI00260F995F|nr:GntR family transcriptional regulator [Hydrocarboniphaga sp.]MDB5973087.1 transcriptional regulator [Hydrocarboniphaga sp.]